MRIVFVGAVEFSLRCLQELLRLDAEIAGIVTVPIERAARHSDFVDLAPLADRHGIPLHRTIRINDPESIAWIAEREPDTIFVFGFSQLISKAILDLPPRGCVGSHPALLPANRGRHPLIWTLVEGLDQGGLTFFYLDEGADSGNIIWQDSFPVGVQDDARVLYDRILELGARAMPEVLDAVRRGDPGVPQDHTLATYWPKRGRDDGEVRWDLPARKVHDLIRALAEPYPGAHTFLGAAEVKLWRSLPPERTMSADATGSGKRPAPGTVLSIEGALVVQTGTGPITITNWDPPAGVRLAPGMILGRAIP